MMILKEPGPWKREAEVLQQGFKKAGINATSRCCRATQWFDRLYTKRNHDGIAVNAGSPAVPMGADRQLHDEGDAAQEPAEVPEAGDPRPRGRLQHRVLAENEAQYSSALKSVQRLMLTQAAAFHTMIASNQNVAPKNLLGVDSTLIGDQRFDGAYFA